MVFIETSLFTKLLPSYLGDDDYRGLQNNLLQHPESGDVVRGSGGVRKVVVLGLFIIEKNLIVKCGC